MIIQKILRSLPSRVDAKVSVIEEAKYLNAFFMDEMYGLLTAYEMRTRKTKSSDKEVVFKVAEAPNPKKTHMKIYRILENPTFLGNSKEDIVNIKVSYLQNTLFVVVLVIFLINVHTEKRMVMMTTQEIQEETIAEIKIELSDKKIIVTEVSSPKKVNINLLIAQIMDLKMIITNPCLWLLKSIIRKMKFLKTLIVIT